MLVPLVLCLGSRVALKHLRWVEKENVRKERGASLPALSLVAGRSRQTSESSQGPRSLSAGNIPKFDPTLTHGFRDRSARFQRALSLSLRGLTSG